MIVNQQAQQKWDKERLDAEWRAIDALIAGYTDDELEIAKTHVVLINPGMAAMLKGDPRKSKLLKSKIVEWLKGKVTA